MSSPDGCFGILLGRLIPKAGVNRGFCSYPLMFLKFVFCPYGIPFSIGICFHEPRRIPACKTDVINILSGHTYKGGSKFSSLSQY